MRVLLDITTQNLTLLDSEERSKCIDMMLSKFHFIFLNVQIDSNHCMNHYYFGNLDEK